MTSKAAATAQVKAELVRLREDSGTERLAELSRREVMTNKESSVLLLFCLDVMLYKPWETFG